MICRLFGVAYGVNSVVVLASWLYMLYLVCCFWV